MENVVLIGFMGSGKTSCGKAYANMISACFKDTDEMIEIQQQMSVSDIFEKYGEPYFRQLETKLVESIIGSNVGVLSVGGGLAVTSGNDKLLKQIGKVIYLKASKETLVKRLEKDTTRPLLATGNLEEKISNLMAVREDVYMSVADIVIDTDGLSVDEVAKKIYNELS